MFLTPEEAAEELQVKPATIAAWARLGKIPARKGFGGKWRINWTLLLARLKSGDRFRLQALERAKNAPPRTESYAMERYHYLKRATPKWANKRKIAKLYKLAQKLTAETGIKHHVDHILPLKGRTVSGLHVEANLRVVPWHENLRRPRIYQCS